MYKDRAKNFKYWKFYYCKYGWIEYLTYYFNRVQLETGYYRRLIKRISYIVNYTKLNISYV